MASPKKKLVYGMLWPITMEQLAIEFSMIKRGGTIFRESDQTTVGNGLFWHWKRAQELIWPDKKWHKWNLLQSECYTKYRTIVVMGPASSGKTNTSATDAMLDYYIYPSCTSVIVCSTTRERLQDRIWAEIVKYHREAQERYPWLPGHVIEGRIRIVTDERSMSQEGRDFRNGVIGVACFPSGSMVDTPNGPRRIEAIQPGDTVVNAHGIGTVRRTLTRISKTLIRVTLIDGRKIDCTPEHPFFTARGWVKAVDLMTSDMVLSACETMRLMRGRHKLPIPKLEILPALQSLRTRQNMSLLRLNLAPNSSNWSALQKAVLLSGMCQPLGIGKPATNQSFKTLQALREGDEKCSFSQEILFDKVPQSPSHDSMSSMRKSLCFDSRIPRTLPDALLQQILQEESDWAIQFQKACSSHSRRDGSLESFQQFHSSLSLEDRLGIEERVRPLVSTGSCIPGHKTGHRNRWRRSSHSVQAPERFTKDRNPRRTRVDSVEILEPRCDPRFIPSEGGYRVYNLEIDCHPSYSVNGVVVHYCR